MLVRMWSEKCEIHRNLKILCIWPEYGEKTPFLESPVLKCISGNPSAIVNTSIWLCWTLTFHFHCACSFSTLSIKRKYAGCFKRNCAVEWNYYYYYYYKQGKVHPITGHEGPEAEYGYSSTHSLTSLLDGSGWSLPHPDHFIPQNETWYLLYRRLSGPQGW